MKQLTLLLLFSLILLACQPQTTEETETGDSSAIGATDLETFNFVTNHKKVWDEAVNQVIEIAEAMPEEQYGYRPHDSVRTFAQQIVHIAVSSKIIADLYINDIPPPEGPRPDGTDMTKEEIITLCRTQLNETGDIFLTASDQKLNEEIKSFRGQDMTRMHGLLTVHDHLTNHKAKANLYVRISGNEPPAYRYY